MKWVKRFRLAALTLLGAVAAASLVVGIYRAAFTESGSGDFQWSPSRLLLDRENPYRVYLDLVAKGALRSEGSPFVLNQHADYPAASYVLLWPYALFDWSAAKKLWLASNIALAALYLLGVFRFAEVGDPLSRFALVVLFVGCTPFRAGLGNGQHGTYSLAFFLLAAIFVSKNRGLSGLFLALSWLKFTLTLPLSLFFVVRRRFDVLAIAALTHLFLWVLASWWIGTPVTSVVSDYLNALGEFPVTGDIDVFGLLARVNLLAEVVAPWAMAFLLVLTGVAAARMREAEDSLVLSFLALSSCLVLVHHEYDNIVLAIPMACVLSRSAEGSVSVLLGLCVGWSWYGRKLVETALKWTSCDTAVTDSIVFFFTAAVFYATWCVFLLRAGRQSGA